MRRQRHGAAVDAAAAEDHHTSNPLHSPPEMTGRGQADEFGEADGAAWDQEAKRGTSGGHARPTSCLAFEDDEPCSIM